MFYAYGCMRVDVQAGSALISALVNGVPQQCGQILKFSEHDFRTLNSAVPTFEGHLLNSAVSIHLSLSYT